MSPDKTNPKESNLVSLCTSVSELIVKGTDFHSKCAFLNAKELGIILWCVPLHHEANTFPASTFISILHLGVLKNIFITQDILEPTSKYRPMPQIFSGFYPLN